MNKGTVRLSSIQKDVLFLLFALEQKGNKEPVEGSVLLKMINGSRSADVFCSNFRASCHKLNEHELIEKYRSQRTLKLAWCLSDAGRHQANKIYINRLAN